MPTAENKMQKNEHCIDKVDEMGIERFITDCPVLTAIAVIGGKWKIPILYTLRSEPVRFNELRKALTGITQKMLTQCLRELEADGLVSRKVYPQIPPKVEYSITPLGMKLEPILSSLCVWGTEYKRVKGL